MFLKSIALHLAAGSMLSLKCETVQWSENGNYFPGQPFGWLCSPETEESDQLCLTCCDVKKTILKSDSYSCPCGRRLMYFSWSLIIS